LSVQPRIESVGRRNPAPGVHIRLDEPNWVLLTVATEDRQPWLASGEVQPILHETWAEATAWLVSDYLLMPDHLHCFCAPQHLEVTLEAWITYWKRLFRRKHGNPDWRFQSRGWHHRLRSDESQHEKWLYVQENPVRRGWVARMEDWPYKGRVHEIHR
jgi:putative transposase